MAALADAIELFLHILSKDNHQKPSMERSAINSASGCIYALFGFLCIVVFTKHSDKDFSGILTASAVVQLLGFLALTIKVRATKSVAGISSKTLEMYALFFLCRLASTTMKNGYIPVDKSGRYVYQIADCVSLLVVLQLLWCIHKTYKWTYQSEEDTMSVFPLIPPCIVLGIFIHADLNRSMFYDTVWAISTNIDTLAMLPQLWMMTKVGGKVEGCTAHFVVGLVASRALALAFWAAAYEDIVDDGYLHFGRASMKSKMKYRKRPLFDENHEAAHVAAGMIVVANIIQLLLAADFMYYYVKARWRGTAVSLPKGRVVDAQDI